MKVFNNAKKGTPIKITITPDSEKNISIKGDGSFYNIINNYNENPITIDIIESLESTTFGTTYAYIYISNTGPTVDVTIKFNGVELSTIENADIFSTIVKVPSPEGATIYTYNRNA